MLKPEKRDTATLSAETRAKLDKLINRNIFVLKTAFKIRSGYLAIRYNIDRAHLEIPMPTESVERLFLCSGSKKLLINRLNDLTGWVQIDSPAAALSFLRLPTSPRTYYLTIGTPNELKEEVLSKESLNAGLTYGDGVYLPLSKLPGNGYSCIIDQHLYKKLGLPPLSIEPKYGGFLVGRTLFVESYASGDPVQRMEYVHEWVSSTGQVQTVDYKILPRKLLSAVDWYIPKFA